MIEHRQLMIFGLTRDDDESSVRRLIGHCPAESIRVEPVPGDNEQSFALLQLPPDPLQAARWAGRIGDRRHAGRRLQAWVSSMPWA